MADYSPHVLQRAMQHVAACGKIVDFRELDFRNPIHGLAHLRGKAGYRGPGKLEGSIVNWLNGPVFQRVGERAGFRVSIVPFRCRADSSAVALEAHSRDAYGRRGGKVLSRRGGRVVTAGLVAAARTSGRRRGRRS